MVKAKKHLNHPNAQSAICAWLYKLQTLLTAIFVLTLPLLFYVGNTNMSYTKAVYVVIGVSVLWTLWALEWWFSREISIRIPSLIWPGLFVLLAAALSMVNATNTSISLEKLGMVLLFGMLFLYISNLTRDKRTFFLLLAALCLSASLVGGYALLQLFEWVQKGEISGRVIATLGNPNAVAEFINSVLLVLLVFFVIKSPTLHKLGWLLALPLAWAGFVVVNSTGGWGSLVASMLVLGTLLLAFRKKLWPLKRARGWLMVVLLIVASSVLWFNTLRINQPQPSANSSRQDATATQMHKNMHLASVIPLSKQFNPFDYVSRLWQSNDGQVRQFFWLTAFEMYKDYPWFGIGLGHYEVHYINYRGALYQSDVGQHFIKVANELFIDAATVLRPSQTHNDYLQVLAEMGILGAVSVAVFLIVLVWCAFRHIKHQASETVSVLLILLYAGVAAYLADALVNFPVHLPASSLNFVLLLGLAHSRFIHGTSGLKINLAGARLALLGVAVVIGAVVLTTLAVRDWQGDVQLVRGKALKENNLLLSAEQALELSAALSFAPVEVLYHLATLNVALGKHDRAFEYFDRSIKARLFEDTLWRLANLHFLREEFEQANGYIQRLKNAVLEGGRTHLEALYLEATIAIHTANPQLAASIAESAMNRYPEFEKMLLVWADAAFIQQQYPLACSLYQRGLLYVEEGLLELNEFLAEAQASGDAGLIAQTQTTLAQLGQQQQGIMANLQALQSVCE